MQIPYDRRNPGQKKFHEDISSKFLMACGGLGSGKTFCLWRKMMQMSAIEQDLPGGLLAPTIKEFKRDVLPIARETLDTYVPGYKYHETDMYFTFPWSDAPLYVFTAERPIKGPNLAYAGINEFSSMEYERIQQMINRVRHERGKVLMTAFAGTPEDEYLWLEEFVDKHLKSGRLNLIEMATTDNKHISTDYIETLRETLDDQSFKLYVLGQRIRLGGDYFYYAYDQKKNDFPCEHDTDLTVHACMDFNVGNMSTTLWHVVGSGNSKQLLAFGEIILTDYGSDTESMGRAVKERFGTEKVLITCDASGKARKTTGRSDVQILENMGFTVRCKSVNPKLRKRQILVNGLLARKNIFLNPKTCPILKRDLLRVTQDKATFEKKKDKPELTHTSDTLDYLADFEFKDWLDKEAREHFFIKKR